MGRWRRKRPAYSRDDSSASSKSDYKASTPRGGFTRSDRQLLIKYLTDYRDAAEQLCFSNPDGLPDIDVMATKPQAKNILTDESETPVSIAGQDFPGLTRALLTSPYVELPKTLTPKQRRTVHECCVDVDLFHLGVGNKVSRRIVISIFSDGLSFVPELSPPKHRIPLRHCRPWFHRNDHSDEKQKPSKSPSIVAPSSKPSAYVKEATRVGRESIERLLDQPGTCLRDGQDVLDFQKLDIVDLSSIPPLVDSQDDSWMLVDTPAKMQHCVQELHEDNPSEIGFDLEMYNTSKYYQVSCLFQLSSSTGKDYIVDVLAPGVWDAVPLLAPLFADCRVCKIGHGIGGMDVSALHRDFGIFVTNAFDTYEAAKALRLKRTGLASVCKHYGLRNSDEYRLLKEDYQNTDWTQRPLTKPMLRYGRTDVHYLCELRRLMMRDLTRKELWDDAGISKEKEAHEVARALAETLRSMQQLEGDVDEDDIIFDTRAATPHENGGISSEDQLLTDDTCTDCEMKKSVFGAKELRMQTKLMTVVSLSQQRCLDLWRGKSEPPMKCAELMSVVKRAAAGDLEWTNSHMMLYNDLVEWRNEVARKEGVLSDTVCPLELLVTIARKRPIHRTALRRIKYFLSPLLEEEHSNYIEEILSVVKCYIDDSEVNDSGSTRTFSAFSQLGNQIVDRCRSSSDVPRTGSNRLSPLSLTVVSFVTAAVAVAAVLTLRKRK